MTDFQRYAENLYDENPRGAWELEAMKYGIMARLGLSEKDALELACKIVASPKEINHKEKKMSENELADLFEGMTQEQAQRLSDRIIKAAQREREAMRSEDLQPLIDEYKRDMAAAPRGYAGNSIRARIKERARRQGVPVDSVVHSGVFNE